jgi:uncharacterized protein YxeA
MKGSLNFKQKKAQGLSMSLIIIAILALLVLIIVGYFIAKGAKNINKDSERICLKSNGILKTFSECNIANGETWGIGYDKNTRETKKCCIKIMGGESDE